jgi:HemY protein
VHFFRRLPATKRSKKESQRLQESNEALLEGLHALADGDYIQAEAATKRAHDLIHDANLEKLIQTIAVEKQKQEV